MISLKKLWRDKRGNVLAIAAGALPLVIGSAGLASDTIQWVLWKRELQRAADSAAIAGVYAKIQPQNVPGAVNTDLDKNNYFSRPAVAATHNGLDLLAEPIITYPANGGGLTDQVQVQLSLQKPLGFSSFFMSSPPTIRASATAATIATGAYCVVSLENTSATGISASGTGDVNLGCGMITNSTSLGAAVATGASDVHATPIAAVGNVTQSDNWNGAELLPFTAAQADPYAGVDPITTGCPATTQISVNSNQTGAFGPGCYNQININGTVTLSDGIYIVDGGGVSFGSQARVTCAHCTFILTNHSSGQTATIGGLDINATAHVELGATVGGTYDGILFYQDRRSDSTGNHSTINGDSTSTFQGAFYFPRTELRINGSSGLNFTCGQWVSRTIVFNGNGSINNVCNDYGNHEIRGRHVRLVA